MIMNTIQKITQEMIEMPYFTDMILVPASEGPDASELKRALAGSGMIKCAKSHLQVDMMRLKDDPHYRSNVELRLAGIMDNPSEIFVSFDTAGAWGGPGGYDDAYGAPVNEPVRHAIEEISGPEVSIGLVNYSEYLDSVGMPSDANLAMREFAEYIDYSSHRTEVSDVPLMWNVELSDANDRHASVLLHWGENS
jgi:hypothetical protein